MAQEAMRYVAVLVLLVVGTAALLAGEFFHGVEFLVYVGGALALLAVGGLTANIAQA